jgi:TonB family protein
MPRPFLLLLLVCGCAPAQPRALQKVEPEYTPEARSAGFSGNVALYVEIDSQGKPTLVDVIQPAGLGLDEKAVAAVRQWQFPPPVSGGKPAAKMGLALDVPFRQDGAAWSVPRAVYGWPKQPDVRGKSVLVKPVLAAYTSPDPAVCQGASGTVAVGFAIGKDGTPGEVKTLRGAHGEAADAAVRAVQAWRYRPGTRNRKAVSALAEVELACGAGPPAAPAAHRVGGGVTAPRLVYKVEPEYSEPARKAKFQGTALIYVEVGPDGYATNIRTVRMVGLGLDEKAVEAVRQWRFLPGMKDGAPVTVAATIEVNFRLL